MDQKRNPETIYENEKTAFENELNDIFHQIKNTDIREILREYFTTDDKKAQRMDKKRLEELAKELNKFVEVDRQQSSKQQVVRRSPDASAQKNRANNSKAINPTDKE